MLSKLDLSQATNCRAFHRSQFYLDDILITGQTEAEHLRRLDEVLASFYLTCQRLPLPSGGELELPVPAETILLMEHLDSSPITSV